MNDIIDKTKGVMHEAMCQAIANTAIEGHEPADTFLTDAALVADGHMTVDDAIARVVERYS
jgi:hypothetical protein